MPTIATGQMEHMRIGRVLYEDDDHYVLKINKSTKKDMTLDEDTSKNQFLTMMFIHNVSGRAKSWLPWKK